MLKTALACVVLALGSGCVGNVDPESGEPVDEITETSDDAVDEVVANNPLYEAVANNPLYSATVNNPLYEQGLSGGGAYAVSN